MTYRPEIDGLRALAVLPVMLFHAGYTSFSGGFVGVDIFFVLSGYLITTIIVGEAERGTFSLVRFYERRARRILPALLLVSLVTIPFAYAWMTRQQWHDYTESLFSVATFSSNILFWLQTDYFSTSSELKPLLHTWSLAVEEQFYIVFPLLIMLIMRINRKALTPALIIIALGSLGWSEYAARAYASANFYLLPSRAWELLAGACCAMALRHAAVMQSMKTGGSAHWHVLKIPAAAQHILAVTGIIMIGIAMTYYDAATPFPSLYALLPVGGTAALILFLRPGFWLTRLLSITPLVAIGLISYSAYLWHQPVLAFYKLTHYVHDPIMMGVMLLISLMLAAFSYWLVEQPVRFSLLKKRSATMFLMLSVGLLTVMAALGLAGRFAPITLPHEVAYGKASYSGDGYGWREKLPAKTSGDTEQTTILYGDSVARQYISGLHRDDSELEFIGAPSCVALPLAFRKDDGAIAPECLANIDLLYNALQAKPDALLVIAQEWHVQLQTARGDSIGDGNVADDPATLEALIFNIDLIARKLPPETRLVLVGQTPSTHNAGDMLYGGPDRCAQYSDVICPRSAPRNLVSARTVNARLAEFAALYDHVGFVDPMDSLCDAQKCNFWRDGQPLYYDDNHLTQLGAQPVTRAILETASQLKPKAEQEAGAGE